MGQKVDPRGLRIGITRTWDSNWFAEKKEYINYFLEDKKVREFVKKAYYHAGIAKIEIERSEPTSITIIVHTAKAGILIGKKGAEIEELKAKLEKMTSKKVMVKVQEVKMPTRSAVLVAESIAQSIEKRVAFKKAMNQAIMKAEKSRIKGMKVAISGRLNGADIARTEWKMIGRVPLHTLRADIDYAVAEAMTTYGKLGVKVWIFNGEKLPTKRTAENGGN